MEFSLQLLLFFILATTSSTNTLIYRMTSDNHDEMLAASDVVFVSFYTTWCGYSRRLLPIFLNASSKYEQDHPDENVIWALVDCDQEPELADRYLVSTLPTMRIFVNGDLIDGEYLGDWTIDALSTFVAGYQETAMSTFTSMEALRSRTNSSSKNNIIGQFKSRYTLEFANFKSLSAAFRDECVFWLGSASSDSIRYLAADDLVIEEYAGKIADFKALLQFIAERCAPTLFARATEDANDTQPISDHVRSIDNDLSTSEEDPLVMDLLSNSTRAEEPTGSANNRIDSNETNSTVSM